MPILKNLTFTAVPARSLDPIANRRAKLIERLQEQKADVRWNNPRASNSSISTYVRVAGRLVLAAISICPPKSQPIRHPQTAGTCCYPLVSGSSSLPIPAPTESALGH